MYPESLRPPPSSASMDLLRAHVSALFSLLLSVQGPWKLREEAQILRCSHRVQVRYVPQVGYLELELAQAMAERAKWASLLGTASAGKETVCALGGWEAELGALSKDPGWSSCSRKLSDSDRF